MYEENNTPDAICREKRLIEVWPSGETSYTVYEDDGKYISNETEEAEGYERSITFPMGIMSPPHTHRKWKVTRRF